MCAGCNTSSAATSNTKGTKEKGAVPLSRACGGRSGLARGGKSETHTPNVTIDGRRPRRPRWPNHPDRPVLAKIRSMARIAIRQRQYDERTFSARLAKVLQRHGMAVRTTCTSSSVIRDITDQLARLASKEGRDSSNEDIPAWHGLCGPERPPRR
jgi:hypothetical protein